MLMAKDNYHDKGYKELLSKQRNFVKFLRHFVKSEWVKHVDERNLHLCDKGFVDPFFKELESDLIYSAKVSGRDVYFFVLTELQSTIDFTIPFRIFRYISAILMREFNDTPKEERKRSDFRLPAVVPILFYNGEKGWFVTRNFKNYLQDGNLFDGVIDFSYTLVDINLLDKEYLQKNHDAICAAIAVDKVRSKGYEQLFEALKGIVSSKSDFTPEEFGDFLTWLKHSLEHRVGSEDEAERVIELIKEGDTEKMRTGIDIIFDNVQAETLIEAAAKLVKSGLSIQEVSERLEFTQEQIKQLEEKLSLKREPV